MFATFDAFLLSHFVNTAKAAKLSPFVLARFYYTGALGFAIVGVMVPIFYGLYAQMLGQIIYMIIIGFGVRVLLPICEAFIAIPPPENPFRYATTMRRNSLIWLVCMPLLFALVGVPPAVALPTFSSMIVWTIAGYYLAASVPAVVSEVEKTFVNPWS